MPTPTAIANDAPPVGRAPAGGAVASGEWPLRVLSLGAGVQSSVLFLMSCLGELPKLDYAIFSDTGWERAVTYRHLEWLEKQSEKYGIPIIRVSAGNIRQDLTNNADTTRGNGRMPFWVRNEKGEVGKLKRQCTHDYKIIPVERKIKELLGLKRTARWPTERVCEHWFGISVDEHKRMRFSGVLWKSHEYPLVFGLPRAYSRHDCKLWCQARGFPIPPDSSCIGCSLHGAHAWRELTSEEFKEACDFDTAIRRRPNCQGDLFVHRSGVPLVQIDLSTPEERGQGAWREGCDSGYCGT